MQNLKFHIHSYVLCQAQLKIPLSLPTGNILKWGTLRILLIAVLVLESAYTRFVAKHAQSRDATETSN